MVLRGTKEYCEVLRVVLRDTTRYNKVPFVTLRDIMSNFFVTLSNASKFLVVQYHRKTRTVESFLVALSASGCNFTNGRTCFFREFYKIFHNDLFERRTLGECL